MSINHKVSCAQIAQFEVKEANQNVRELICHANEDHKYLLQQLQMIYKRLEADESNEILRNQSNDLLNRLEECNCRKQKLWNESARLLTSNRNGKRQISALYDQVGDFPKNKVVISVDDMTTTHSDLTQSTLEVRPDAVGL